MMMVYAIQRGLRLADFDEMSIGMILDYIAQHDRLHTTKEEEKREAGQTDFNGF